MTRKEVNQQLLNEMVKMCEKRTDDILTIQDFFLSQITLVLADISKSLAVIADSMNKKESEE